MSGLTLDIIHNTDATQAKHDAGIEYLLTECDIRPVIFYQINAIGTYEDLDGSLYSYIYSNGDKFVCLLDLEDLKKAVDNWVDGKVNV